MITFTEPTLDSADILRRLEELREERKGLIETLAELQESIASWPSRPPEERDDPEELDELRDALSSTEKELVEWLEDNEEELEMLESVEDECDADGALWVHEGHMQSYAQELAGDLGKELRAWPYTCIDWEQAAKELAEDYTVVEVGGETYYIT